VEKNKIFPFNDLKDDIGGFDERAFSEYFVIVH